MNLKEGQLITFSSGEYSDYCVDGLVEVIIEFDFNELKNTYENEHTCKDVNSDVRRIKKGHVSFLSFLVNKGLVKKRDYLEIHVGSYGESEIGFW